MDKKVTLQVLLVDDDPKDLQDYQRDFPPVFEEAGVHATIHAVGSFEEAFTLADDPSRRFDLILTDTYRGDQSREDAAVINLISRYRGSRFCPVVVFSASARPDTLPFGAFVVWSDKAESGGIEKAIRHMLGTGIPQAARSLHNDLDRLAGSYLWDFLDKNWEKLNKAGHCETDTLQRIIRRRAALQLAELTYTEAGPEPLDEVHGIEFYVYPPLNDRQYSLGEIIQNKSDPKDIRVILTPHCYLTIQANKTEPRASFVKTIKAVPVAGVLDAKEVARIKGITSKEKRHSALGRLVTPPSRSEVGVPEGRFWYLPEFVDIPHMYCDFLQVNSVAYAELRANYRSLAVLTPPYAESLQACYVAFHAAVGIPNVKPSSVEGILG